MARAKGAHANWVLVAVAIAAVVIWQRYGETIQAHFKGEQSAQKKAIRSAEIKYENARRNGGDAERCRAADAVVAAYLRVGDGPDLQRWQRIRAEDCR